MYSELCDLHDSCHHMLLMLLCPVVITPRKVIFTEGLNYTVEQPGQVWDSDYTCVHAYT